MVQNKKEMIILRSPRIISNFREFSLAVASEAEKENPAEDRWVGRGEDGIARGYLVDPKKEQRNGVREV